MKDRGRDDARRMAVRPALVTGILLLAAASAGAVGCSMVPNMDAGGAGCQNARGIGRPQDLPDGGTNMNVMPDLRGKGVAAAAALARSRGHTVVFNVQGTCWCVPPPGGTVTDQWYGEHGALWLWVEGLPTPTGDPGFLGYGC